MTGRSADNFASQLKAHRIRNGWSQTDLAVRATLKPSAISHFERSRRRPSLENLCKLADVLSVSTDALLSERADI